MAEFASFALQQTTVDVNSDKLEKKGSVPEIMIA